MRVAAWERTEEETTPPGSLRLHDGHARTLLAMLDATDSSIGVRMFPHSTHALGISDAIELARAMGVLPTKVIVYGIEADNTETGQALSCAVTKALDEAVGQIIRECEVCLA